MQSGKTFTPIRVAALIFAATLGLPLLNLSLNSPYGSAKFYPLALGLALVWAGGWWLISGRQEPLADCQRPESTVGIVGGIAIGALFVTGFYLTRFVPALSQASAGVIQRLEVGPLWSVGLTAIVTGITEELFFRGAIYRLFQEHSQRWIVPVIGTTIIYTLVTIATENLSLVLASTILGFSCALVRAYTKTPWAAALTHATWSIVMTLVFGL